MKISTKGRYGLRFMLDVAEHGRAHNVTLKDVAKRQAISEKYLWQIVRPLKGSGLIRTILGPGGGYALAKDASEITLNDILGVLEGDDNLAACIDEPSVCERSANCVSREVWKDLNQKMTEVMNSISLSSILQKQKKMTDEMSLSYCI